MRGLLQRYGPQEPPEIVAIRRYILETFNAASSVGMQGDAIVVTVPSAAFANTLRFHTAKMQAAADTTKRIMLRIG